MLSLIFFGCPVYIYNFLQQQDLKSEEGEQSFQTDLTPSKFNFLTSRWQIQFISVLYSECTSSNVDILHQPLIDFIGFLYHHSILFVLPLSRPETRFHTQVSSWLG